MTTKVICRTGRVEHAGCSHGERERMENDLLLETEDVPMEEENEFIEAK